MGPVLEGPEVQVKAVWFPYAMMALNVGASLTYFAEGNIRQGIYWLAACTLTACVSIPGGQ